MFAPPLTDAEPFAPEEARLTTDLVERLELAFRQSFAVVNASQGVLERVTNDWPRVDVFRWLPMCEQVARTGRVEVLEDHAPLMLLAAPVDGGELAAPRVAVAVLLTDPSPTEEALASAARAFGVDAKQLEQWAVGRRAWPAYAAVPLAGAIVEAVAARRTAATTKTQLSEVSSQLLATFEELHLLHQLTEGLTLGRSENELLEQAVGWLGDVVRCNCVVARLPGHDAPTIVHGRRGSPLEDDRLDEFFERLGPQAERRAIVLNTDRTNSPTWLYPEVREVVTAPILANDESIGWIAAFNHLPTPGSTETGFGTVEASLLSSVATLIGVHASNRTLFNEKTELFDSAVHTLTSAIDAKDRYTCGHSDRVARVAVRIAKELGCTTDELSTIYLGGLLHDIGKIGIDDAILRKPGELTPEEFEHIKTHPTLGEQILRGVPQLGHVLPIVLHHHEAWNGSGYPGELVGEECPLLARIVAVADSFDAMGSDRPYRKGIPVKRIEEIFREGAGKQWDPAIIEAYFACRNDIAALSRVEREPLDLNVGRWEIGDSCPLPVTDPAS